MAMIWYMYSTVASSSPSSHKEQVEDDFNEKGSCGFTFGNGCSGGTSEGSLFGKKPQGSVIFEEMPKSRRKPAEAGAR